MTFLIGGFGKICRTLKNRPLTSMIPPEKAVSEVSTLQEDSLLVLAGTYSHGNTSDKVYKLPDGKGFFLGRLFEEKSDRDAQFNSEKTSLLFSHPHLITQQFWGRYIGVLYQKKERILHLVRDPLGLSTLFYYATSEGLLFASELSLLYHLLDPKPPMDWNYFAERIIDENHTLHTTPFLNVRELLPGTKVAVRETGVISQENLWDLNALKGSYIQNRHDFEEKLLTMLKVTTKAWVNSRSNICLEISGGTDSSSLLILLRHLLADEQKIIGINYMDSCSPSSNEIEHAKEISQICGADLHFVDWQTTSLFDPLPPDWRPDRPSGYLFFYGLGQQIKEIASSHGCSEILNGQGGDHLFLAPPPQNALADLWLDRGFKNFPTILRELSGIQRMSWSGLISKNLKSVFHYYRKSPSHDLTLHPYLFKKAEQHPFYLDEQLRLFHPAKAEQIKGLFHAVYQSYRNQRLPQLTYTHPILSQPLVELALQIPTYQSFGEGFDRIFLRKSIQRLKNSKNLWRHTKGGTIASLLKAFAANSKQVSTLLIEGDLVKNEILNKSWVHEELTRINHGQCLNLWPLWQALACQVWLNQWKL